METSSVTPVPWSVGNETAECPVSMYECTDEGSIATVTLLSEVWPAAKSPSQPPEHSDSGNQELSVGV